MTILAADLVGRICTLCKRPTSWTAPKCGHCGMPLFVPKGRR